MKFDIEGRLPGLNEMIDAAQSVSEKQSLPYCY